MPRPTSPAARRLPTLLLLGLLALLLWGQCGALLFPGGGRSRAPDFYGSVLRTDSLLTNPPRLLLTLRLHNTLQTPVTVQKLNGSLRFGRREFPFSTPSGLRGRRLLVFDELTPALVVPLPLPPDSLALLRALLDDTNAHSGQVYLRWNLHYTTDQNPHRLTLGSTSDLLPALGRPGYR